MIYPQLELVIRMFSSKFAYFTNKVDYKSFPCPRFRLYKHKCVCIAADLFHKIMCRLQLESILSDVQNFIGIHIEKFLRKHYCKNALRHPFQLKLQNAVLAGLL